MFGDWKVSQNYKQVFSTFHYFYNIAYGMTFVCVIMYIH